MLAHRTRRWTATRPEVPPGQPGSREAQDRDREIAFGEGERRVGAGGIHPATHGNCSHRHALISLLPAMNAQEQHQRGAGAPRSETVTGRRSAAAGSAALIGG